jgi:hypothetical protein
MVLLSLTTGIEYMPRHTGGRGVKAPYETTHVRVPVPIKADVERLIARFHQDEETEEDNPLTTLDEAVVTAKNILASKKSAKVSMSKLLTAIYGESVEL